MPCGISLYSTLSNLNASSIERFNRTLKNKMWSKCNSRGNYEWVEILPYLISKYNNTKHRTIGMKCKDVKPKHEKELFQRFQKQRKKISRKIKY